MTKIGSDSPDKSPEVRWSIYQDPKSWNTYVNELESELTRLKGLVREMVPFVRGCWCASEDQHTVWPDWDKARKILDRNEVKAIMEGK